MKRLRKISQGVFLTFFVLIFIFTKSDSQDKSYTDFSITFYIDPLIALAKFLSAHTIDLLFLISTLTIILTIFTGRSFCGWICPLGTLNDIIGSFKKREKEIIKKSHLRIKYLVLIIIIVLAIFGINITGFLDPLSLLMRSFTILLYPAYNMFIHTIYNLTTNLSSLSDILPKIYSFLKEYLIENKRVYFYQSILIGTIFLSVLFLNLAVNRFWCRFICPLGALLGIFGRYSLLKKEIKPCSECGACEVNCNGGAIPLGKAENNVSECILCMNCSDICPDEAINFYFSKKKINSGVDIGKRNIIASGVSALLLYPLFRSSVIPANGFHSSRLIRPPGARREDIFIKMCIKCGACMKGCITNGLQPTMFEAGLEGMWTPMLVPRIGHCEYNCNLCSQLCPTGAIRPITMSEKQNIKIGTAQIDKNRCIAYRDAKGCLVCEEVCPIPDKAIKIENISVQIANNMRSVKAPRVVSSLCIGCGICEKNCPVVDAPAIYVTSIGERRSEENQELLE